MPLYTGSEPLALGADAPDFTLPGVDGKDHPLSDYRGGKALIVIFSCNHCPYVKAYEQRMIDFGREYAQKDVPLVVINANDAATYPEDSFEKMKERATEKAFPFDYLYDESQEVAHAFGAICTPHAFLFDSDGKLAYQGALDDNWKDESAVEQRYLRDAVEAVLANKEPDTTVTQPVGCSVKWK